MIEKSRPSGQSESVENFLKAIYALQQKSERVSTNDLAEALKISAPSVTDMARRLVETGLVDYRKYYGVRLTPQGEAIALKVIRRHRLIELYLVEELGYALREVHNDAEDLEHVVSDHFMAAIDSKLGHPQIDPHGDPIPSVEGVITRRDLTDLTRLEIGAPAIVSRLISSNQDVLQHILERGFALGASVEVTARDPFNGPVTALVNGQKAVIGYNVATCILVEPVE